jgi:hypothetical protein
VNPLVAASTTARSTLKGPVKSELYRRRCTAVSELCFVLIDDIHDGAPRRPDEQFANVVLGSVGVCLDELVECQAETENSACFATIARYTEPGCRVRVFLAIERV